MYDIEFSNDALVDLRWFKKHGQNEILDSIEDNLRSDPKVETRNRKRLRPNDIAEWELRIGKYRVFYDINDLLRLVSIEAIGLKIGSSLRFRGQERKL